MRRFGIERTPVDRRGVVLILALGMLVLFTIVAITLAAISKTASTSAANFKRLEQFGSLRQDVAPNEVGELFRYAMNQLIYDTRNKQSAIRGHSLLRDMYGSPEKYNLNTAGITLQDAGAELRLRAVDALRISPNANDPFRTDYQGVYNGTGIFLPRKVAFANLITGSMSVNDLGLSDEEIALQTAYLQVPPSLGSFAMTKLPVGVTSPTNWAPLFAPVLSSYPSTLTQFPDYRLWYPRYPINYTVFDAYTARSTSPLGQQMATLPLLNQRLATPTYPGGREIEPELFFASNHAAGDSRGFHWFGFDEDYDYPDINNMFLAMERADGRTIIPSFHRPQLVSQVARGLAKIFAIGGTSPMQDSISLTTGGTALIEQLPYAPEWALPAQAQGQNLRALTLRPRPADYDPAHLGIASPRAGTFPSLPSPVSEFTQMPTASGSTANFDLRLPDDIDQSGFIGDSPSELDVDTDGDGIRDAIWVDLGHPVITVGDTSFKPMYAFKVLDLDGKINLNAHGNFYKIPNADPEQTVMYHLHHSSHLGATPAEVNPSYVWSIGDVPVGGNATPRPHWDFLDTPASQAITQAEQTSPDKRMIFGDARTSPPAPGRWSAKAESTSGSRGSAPGKFNVDDNRNELFEYSEGDGSTNLVSETPPQSRLPAVQGRYSQADFRGIGRRFEPYSEAVVQHASSFGVVPGGGNVLPGLLNHAAGTAPVGLTGAYGAHLASLVNGSSQTGPTPPANGGLDPAKLTLDEPAEANLYDPNPTDDSFFTAAEMAALLSGNDIDESQVNNRLPLLSPAQLHSGPPTAADAMKGYYTSEAYAKKRMRHLLTHASWDLIRFNAPPMTNPYNLLGPTLATDKYAFVTPLSELDPNNQFAPFGRKHTGTVGVDRVFAYLVGNVPANQIPQEYQTIFTQFKQALTDLSTKTTADGRDTLLAREVQEGRRYDLNRPLTSYMDAAGRAVTPDRARLIDVERESIAQQIYVLLYLSCGAMTGPANAGVDKLITKELRCAQGRVLAQIAVNIVDYMDPDSVMTRMRFDPDLSDGWDPNSTAGLNPAPSGPQWDPAVNTVFGFELPELVINEGVAVCVEEMNDPTPMQPGSGDEVRGEKRFVWAELYNPWPGYIDPIDGEQGVLLWKPATVANVNQTGAERSIYMIGVRDQHQSWLDSNLNGPSNQFVSFNVTDSTDYDGIQPTINPPRVLSRDPTGADKSQGYFVVGPADPKTKILRTDMQAQDLLPKSIWLPPSGGAMGANGDNDYTAADFYHAEPVVPKANFKPITVELKLYRLRNPFMLHNNTPGTDLYNPYVCLDYLRLDGNKRAISHWSMQRSGQGWVETANNIPVEAGAYYVPDPANTDEPPAAPPYVDNQLRYSLQRREPWHGYNSEWTPYGRDVQQPLYRDYLSQGEAYLEGLFLGLPSLADNGLIGANDPLQKHGPPEHMENAMVQNGFVPASVAPAPDPNDPMSTAALSATFSRTNKGRANVDVAYKQYLTFPFANRQLVSPLELLNVRMYGSHLWFVGNEAGSGGPLPTGGTTPEWRLRFTDDFEFAVRPWVPSWGTSQMPQGKPMYERVWRSRQIPWYLDSRITHPNWPQLSPADLVTAAQDWDALGNKIAAHSGPQFMAPFPHLYRFFEFVECHNRMFDGDPKGDANKWDFSGQVAKTNRQDRVPGKVNLNTWVDQEVVQGVVDSVSAMYANPLETAQAVQSFLTSGTVASSFPMSEIFWPEHYAESLVSPLGEAALGEPRDYAGRLLGWGELGLASNNAKSVGDGAILPFGGMDIYAALRWQITDPLQLINMPNNLLNAAFSPNRQFPGIIKGPLDSTIGTIYPGTDPNHLFSSEMARAILMSRNGPDGIAGTGDDKPFRSFAAESVSDTILRARNPLTLDFIHGGELGLLDLAQALSSPDPGAALINNLGIVQFLASTYVDSADDAYPTPLGTIAVGDYIVRLGGQWTPRLFDPIPDPYSEELRRMLWAVGARHTLGDQTRPPLNAYDKDVPVDYWMLDNRRNEVLTKIANNTTTRSHVFAVWVTVGLFRVEPGTESLKVPLLGSEVGSEIGRPVRHRAFFIVDRSKATKYDYEDIDANFELPQINLIDYYKIME